MGGGAHVRNNSESRYKFDAEEIRSFLELLWFYVSHETLYYEIFCLNDSGRKIVKFFKGPNAPREATEWLEKNWRRLVKGRYHVCFGVLPRKRRPEKGRGRASDVDRGQWLWADLDYKRSYDSLDYVPAPEEAKRIVAEQGYWYEELEDHALKGVYKAGNKWVYVERPSLSKVLNEVKEKLGIEPAIVVDSGAGYHLYFKLIYDIDASKLRRLEESIVDILKADRQSKDLARVLRLPGTVNPRLNRRVKVISWSLDNEVDPEELMRRLEEITAKQRSRKETTTPTISTSTSKLRFLRDSEILKVKELLKNIYRPGQRQLLCLYLSGWGAHSRIHPVSIGQVIKLLHEETNDEDKLGMRLSTIPYSYKKQNLWNHDIEKEFLTWLHAVGVDKVYGLSSQLTEEAIKGRGGIFELLVRFLGDNEEAEAKANEILRQLSEIFNCGRFELICELIDYEKQLYMCAHLRRRIIARMRRKEDKLILKEKVFPVIPNKVTLYIDPVSNNRRFELEIIGDERILPKPVKIGPAEPPDLVAWLRARGLCYHSRLAEDSLNAVLNAFLKRGIAKVKEEIEKPGFYFIDDKVIAVRLQIKEVAKDELREALELLNELATKWYSHVIEKFSTIIKWGVMAPFSFVFKQRGKWMPWLYLYGASHTGKTTLGEIVLAMWGLGAEHRKTGASIDTVPRLGHVLSQSTLPILINEVGTAVLREDVVEALKNAIESTVARGKFVRGTYTEFPSLAPLIMTSNKVLPRDDALLRRFIILSFTFGERIDLERAREFESKIKPALPKLSILGSYVANKVLSEPELLKRRWWELAEELLENAYREAGLDVPQWIKLCIEHNPTQVYDDIREVIRNFFVSRINQEYSRFVGRIEVVEHVEAEQDGDISERYRFLDRHAIPFEERVKIVLGNNLLPWVMLKENEVLLTTGFAEELRKVVGDLGGLKSIAELLGWSYYPKRSFRIGKKVRNIACISVDIKEFISFLVPEEVHPEVNASSPQQTSEQAT